MSVTFGAGTAPSQVTMNLEGVFAASLANYNKTLVDNISKTNALLDIIMKQGSYKSADGGLYITEELMYALATPNWYDGYDELSTSPTDGLTQAVFQWRQLSVPIAYSEKERKLNKQRIVDLVEARIKQSEIGIHEKLNTAILQGSGAGALVTPATDSLTGASAVDPLPLFIHYTPTDSLAIGNLNQNTYSWWRNQFTVSAATTWGTVLDEFQHMYNTCGLGPGGNPNIILTDQVTYEVVQAAHYNKFRMIETDRNFSWENTKFKNAVITYDERIPNVYAGTLDTTTATGGTAYFINTQYFKLKYESETNFVLGPFQKPVNQDAKVAHILWMGNLTINNRRKHGVIGKIIRACTS